MNQKRAYFFNTSFWLKIPYNGCNYFFLGIPRKISPFNMWQILVPQTGYDNLVFLSLKRKERLDPHLMELTFAWA